MLLKDKYELPVEEVKPAVKYDEVGQRLIKAAARIRKHGWCRGRLSNVSGEYCLHGAIYGVAPGTEHLELNEIDADPIGRAASRLMSDNGFYGMWNDLAVRTKEDVLAALEGMAATRIVNG